MIVKVVDLEVYIIGIFLQLEDYRNKLSYASELIQNYGAKKLIRIGIYSKFWEVLKR